ncbi:transcriptional regulator TbsP domain-containing protein [Halobaculum marinum]|uniref:DUF5821 family protein n=1 Tax=Halobaculum marinum TaxID=3031996 RepID=A0ABD5WVN9_9EURY|nr:DUF5821 family protein [Halobaculum sp. DT55]
MTTRSPSTLAGETLADADDVLLVAPRPALVRAVVDRLRERYDGTAAVPDRVRLLCSPEVAEDAFRDFLVAATAVEAIESGPLAVRTATVDASLSVVDGTVQPRFRLPPDDDGVIGGSVHGAEADGAVSAALAETYDRRWERADERVPDVPAHETLVESFADRWPEAAPELDDAFDAARGTDRSPVTVCTLVAARNRILTMRLGEWAEEVDFSSRTEIARAKSRLVDAGVVDTEREPVGVGRPRHRLVLADEAFAGLAPATLVERLDETLEA